MNSKHLRLLLLGALGVLVLAFAAISVFGLSALSKKSQKMVNLKSESQTLQSQLANLAQVKKEVDQYRYFKDVAKTVIPTDKDQAQAIVDIVRLAEESGISLASFTFQASNLGSAGAAVSGSSTVSQAKPVAGIPGLFSMELTIQPSTSIDLPRDKQVTYAKMIDFFSRIERNRRTAQITSVRVDPPRSAQSTLSFQLIINIFIKP